MSDMRKGKVYLVGAGPGDPELLTLKAVRAIGEADVLLVDDLVNPQVLEHAHADARVVHVGKRGGCKSTPQSFIERLLVAEALAGHSVVRLKGGDPFMFGRGGEEIAALSAAGIDYEVINGISAGLAAATSVGIPLTHRDLCHGVAFVTGHTQSDGSLSWKPILAAGLTLVVYMGMTNLPEIVAELRAIGTRPTLPIAVIQNATLPSQRVLVSTLETIIDDVTQQQMASPSIIVMGEVVTLHRAQMIVEHAQADIQAQAAI